MSLVKRKVLIVVENLSVPLDPRVWREATALKERDYRVSVVCPRGKVCDRAFHENVEGVSIYRFPALEASSGLLSYALEFGWALGWIFLLTFVVFSA